jgi:uncharacterized protein DUF3500
MSTSVRIAFACALVVSALVAATTFAQRGASAPATSSAAQAEVTGRIVASAQAVLATLDEAGRAKVQFPFEGPQRTRWSNLPSGIFQRQGLRMGDLTPPQRTAVKDLLAAALSRDGYRKVTDIMVAIDFVVRGAQPLSTRESVLMTIAGAAILLVPVARRFRVRRVHTSDCRLVRPQARAPTNPAVAPPVAASGVSTPGARSA